jgi:DNA-binding transcriptional LysR family regulator
MYDWNDLRFFLEVARRGKLTSAATALDVNHTTVARRIEALEQRLGAHLFNKTPGGYMLTAAGAQLVHMAEDVESRCVHIANAVGRQDEVLRGSIRVGVPEGFGTRFLAPRMAQFYALYPGIDVELVAGTQFLSISKREADLAITLSRPRVGRVVAGKLSDYMLHLYGSAAYLKGKAPIKTVSDLRNHALIGYVDDLIYAPQLRYLDEVVPQARVKFRSSNINAQFAAADAGLGLCVLPAFMTEGTRLKVILENEIAIRRSFWISMHEDFTHVERVTVVRDWIRKVVTEEQHVLLPRNAKAE